MMRWIKSGAPWIWLCSCAVSLSMIALIGALLLLVGQGVRYFWPHDVYLLTLTDNTQVIGEIYSRKTINTGESQTPTQSLLIKHGNREIEMRDFRTLDATAVLKEEALDDLIVLERKRNGNAYGFLVGLLENGQLIHGNDIQLALKERIQRITTINAKIHSLQKVEIGHINHQLTQLERSRKSLSETSKDYSRTIAEQAKLTEKSQEYNQQLLTLRASLSRDTLMLRDMHQRTYSLPLSDIVDAWQPNSMNIFEKSWQFCLQVWKFLSDSPREGNTEGGVFPAIFGTVLMVLLMSVIVMPLGVIAAIYLHEYAGNSLLTRLIRIAVVNLAGVPSIVYGVFGLGFFVYMIGGSIDQLFYSDMLPSPTFGSPGVLWSALTLALLTLPVVIVTTEEGLSKIPSLLRNGSMALGATKAETLRRIILPMAVPAMMTGLILSIARAAGETAPLMLVGVVKSAPVLPIDGIFPYLHLERKFMHLGFEIYDMAFQSPNVEAARPLVFATALLLVVVVLGLNLTAMVIRHRLREKYKMMSL